MLVKDGDLDSVYVAGKGSGTDIDPIILRRWNDVAVQLHTNIDFSSASAQTIITAPAAGNRIRLCQLLLMSGATSPVNSEVAIKSGSTTIKTVKGTTVVLDFPEHCNLGTAEALVLQATTADRIIGGVDYYVEAV